MTVRLSRGKINRLTDLVLDLIYKLDYVDIPAKIEDTELRMAIRDAIEKELELYRQIEEKVKQKILSQKKNIEEGSREWDILFQKYYREEIAKLDKILE